MRFFLCAAEGTQRNLDEKRPVNIVRDLFPCDPLFGEDALHQAVAGLRATGPHSGTGGGLDLIDVTGAGLDQGAH